MVDQINLFKQYLSEQAEMSETTRACYVSDIRTYAEYLRQNNIDPAQPMTRSRLEEYRRWLLANNRSVSKVNRSMTALRCFCKVMAEQGIMQNDPSRGMRNMPVERCRMATEEEAARVEQMLAEVPKTPRACRDLAMLHLLAGTDLLVQELLQLNVQDVDAGYRQLHIPEHSEPLMLSEETWNALERYLKIRPAMDRREGGEEALFLNWSGGRLSRQGFWKVACEYSKRAGASINLQVLRAYSSQKKYSTLSTKKEKE